MKKRIFSLFLTLALVLPLFAGLTLSAGAANNYAYNSGVRGVACTSLSSAALSYWSGNYSYANLSAQSGDTLRSTLRTKITSNRSTVGYDGLKTYLPYTDAYQGSSSQITLFYSNVAATSAWDGTTWNREHMWPDSLGGNAVEGDLHSMRPTDQRANSTRGNSKYANVRELYPEAYKTATTNAVNGSVIAGYYYSSTYFEPLDASKGDAARVLLYDYVVSTSMSAPTVAIKDIDTLLQWHAMDPVDTYEMQRNDIAESIQGCRNPFVDYPELAWRLYTNYTMPSGMVTPSSGSAYTVTASTNNSNYGTVSVNGYVITATPATGYFASSYTILTGTASVVQSGNTFTVSPSTNCSIRINFAKKTTVTVTLSNDGTTSTVTGYSGEAISLSTPTAPTGYSFVGWVTATVNESTTRPATIYTGSYTPTASCTLYALYSHVTGSGGSSGYALVGEADMEEGTYLIGALRSTSASDNFYFATGSVNSGDMLVTDTAVSIPESNGSRTISSLPTGAAEFYFSGDNEHGFTIVPTSNPTNFLGFSSHANRNLDFGAYSTTKWLVLAKSTPLVTNGVYLSCADSNNPYYIFENSTNNTPIRGYVSGSYRAIYLFQKGGGGTLAYTTTTSSACSHTNTTNVAAVAATCTAGGYTAGVYCNDCGQYISGHAATAALGHNYGAWTSNNNGTHSKTCSRCADVVTESCTYTTSVSGSTVTYTCSVCAYSYQSQQTTYTVSYNDRGSITTASVVQGSSLTLPATASTVSGYTFAGWVTSAIATETTTAPTVLTGSFTPTANITLYACYTRSEAGQSSGGYVKVTSDADLTNGQYLIVNESAGRAMDASKENTIGSGNNYIEVTITNDTIASTSTVDASAFTYNATAGTFATPGGLYICRTSGTSGGAVTTSSDASAAANDVSISSGNATVTCGERPYYLRYNSQGYFRYYTSASQQTIQLYKKGGSASASTYYTTAPTTTCSHTYGSWTSNNDGTHSRTCSKCGDVQNENCTYTSVTSGTTTTFTCSVCGYSYQTQQNTYTVTLNDRGTTTTLSCVEGGSVTLPATASTVTGYTFSGWVESAIPSETAVAPTIRTGTYHPSGSVTLYALYTRSEAGQGSAYTKVSSLGALTSGTFVITSKTTGKAWSQTVSSNWIKPGDTYSGDTISSPTATDVWTISGGTVTYEDGVMMVEGAVIGCSSGNLYSTAAKNVSLSESNSTGWTIVASDDAFLVESGTNNANIMSYNTSSAGWRPYAGGYGQDKPLYFYKLGNGTVTYYTTNPTTASSGLQIVSAAPVLNGKIDMTYTVTVPSGYTNPRMVFSFNGTDTTVTTYTTDSGNLKFTFTGINPQCMGDTITATLYATKNGTTESVSVANYSVKDYCVNKLADNTISTTLRKLLSDLLAYGAAAQTYMNYKTNALVTSGVTGTSYSTFSNLSGNAASFDGTADANTCWVSAGLTLTDSVAMTFRFYTTSASDLTVYVTLGNRTETYTTFTSVGNGVYEISFTGISAEQFGSAATAVFERDSEEVGNELSYSVNAYIQSKQNDSSANLKALVKALYNYGVSAAAYVG
ncbi:MAG: endonuclease [Oscillospiraceae bacterium]|nr:endonuclease [Oscillospiraceae bacterium]